MITIIVGNTKCKLMGLTDPLIIKELDQRMSYSIQGYQFMRYQNGWDGRQRLFTKNHYFPIGLLNMAEEILQSFECHYQIKDNRDVIDYGEPLEIHPKSDFIPRDYQERAVKLAWEKGNGIIRMATGAGKTAALSMIAGRFNIRTVIYVIGIELLYQMKSTLEKLYPDLEIGMVGDGYCDIRRITVSTIWSAASAFDKKVEILDNDLTPFSKNKDKISVQNKEKIRGMVAQAEMFILDECQYSGSETVNLLHRESVAARHRFLLSGTPYRSDGADILIEATGGPKFFDLDASTLIDRKILVSPKIYFLDVPKRTSLGNTYQEVYKNYITENQERNDLIVKAAKKMVQDGRRVLILVSQVAHGKRLLSILKDDLRVSSLDGMNTSEARLAAIQAMKNGELDLLIASKIFDQGIDIPELDALILAGSGKSAGRALQRIGRVIRGFPGKKDAIVVDFMDNCKYLREHSKIRKQIYSTERSFKIIMPRVK